MKNIIAFANQKGGVGKSTSCINIAGILGELGYKVLVIDLDPQGNTTIGLGMNWQELEGKITVYDCIVNELPISEAMIATEYKNIYIIPSYINLANAELEISAKMGREKILSESISASKLDDEFDFILIDLSPTFGLLPINGLTAAKNVIIPVDSGVFAISGIKQLIDTINMVKKKLNPSLNIAGVLLTQANKTNLCKEIQTSLKEIFKDKMFNSTISQSVKVREAQAESKPINYYDKNSKSSNEYVNLTQELLGRMGVK